ncbi:MAG: BREX system P-loop protein BrxC [Prevotellaceae bacterium]|nr:BREX system P-loop protein BrxC [Prevotellaceae bacterium]
MKLKDLYNNPIKRAVNPAVSATKFDAETQKTEIEEYVFTDEIINGLFRILDAIKNNRPFDHVGIWIDGYYGSGKSHFLKYLDYCITPSTQEKALSRLLDAVKAIDPLDDKHDLGFDFEQLLSVANWLKGATIDNCIFNLETSYDNSTDKKKAFLHVFWNEFNGKRGFNKFNITLAQNLEKPLFEKGVFERFKERIAEEGGNWEDPGEAADLIDNELGMVLDIAQELAPTLDKESIRERIIKRDTTMSIDRFGLELASFIKDKGEDYRLILLADEVSQFINKERDRYLNLQEIITKLSEACGNKVWVVCTAQQDLSEIMDDCHINEEKDKEGKIKGRFEVKVSLKGTQPEVITQKRILDKKEDVIDTLADLYKQKSPSFNLQFKLPNSYASYENQEAFIAYYPFVPYQFKLIMQVFNSFLNLGYVAKEVKGNERSIIKVIHATAKKNADAELGKFISFDELYNNMFEEGLQAKGQKAVDNAIRMAATYKRNPQLAKRIANVLFMICNISTNDKLIFPANIDNITSLLINDTETPRLNIKNEVEKIVEYLSDNNIIRPEQGKNGAVEAYSFYSEEEMKVAALIQSQPVDNNRQAEELKDIFFKYITAIKNKELYATRSFAVGATIKQRSFLSNNPDIVIDFTMDCDYDSPEMLALHNQSNRLVYYVGQQFHDNKRLYNAFYWYCQVNSYMSTPANSEENANTRKEFEKRASDIYNMQIAPEFHKILDSCPIISGLSVIDDVEFGAKKGNDRYKVAIDKHMGSIYTKANLVQRSDMVYTTDALKQAIVRGVNPGDYDGLNTELTPAEHEVEIYLNKQFAEVNVADILSKFSKAPYGWDDICTIFVVNELVRRHKRDYSYANNPNVETNTVASHIVAEKNKFTIRQAQAISQELVSQFADAWKDIFGITATFATTDSTQILRLCRDDEGENSLSHRRDAYKKIENQYGSCPFIKPIREAIDLFDEWLAVRDSQKFFNAVIERRDYARLLMDTCKEVIGFLHDQMDNYKNIIDFARNNRENFHALGADYKEQIEAIESFEHMGWPIKIRETIKMRNSLSAALDEQRNALREQIKKAYNETFDLLESSAQQQEVDKSVLSDREATIQLKTKSNSLSVLQINTNTDNFYAEQAARIQKVVRERAPKPVVEPDHNHTGDKGYPKQAAERKDTTMALRTRTVTPLNNEDDVDGYLDTLKKQLMDKINEGYSVTIIK